MQTTLESLSGLARRLNVSLPLSEIDAEVQTRLRKIARTARVSGFRPGKVPLKIVEQQYGPQVREEVLGYVVKKSFGEAVQQQNLKVAGSPHIEPKAVAADTTAFEYTATFEVYPEVKLGEISGVRVTQPTLEVGDAEVERTLEILRKQRTRYEPVERAAATDDRVTIDYRGTIDGVEFAGGAAKDYDVVLGQGRLLKDFEDALIGLAPGGSRIFELKFPDDYHGRDVAGKTAAFEVTVSKVSAPRLPDVDAEFARQMGIDEGDLNKLRTEVRSNVEREVKKRLQGRIKEQVMTALLATTQVEVPKSLVDMEAQRLAQAAMRDLSARGVRVKQLPLPREQLEKQARRRVSLGLILAEILKTHGLQARPDQVRAAVVEHAQSFERPPEVVKWYYESSERLNEIEYMVLEDNVVEWVLKNAQVDDQPISFDELMGNA